MHRSSYLALLALACIVTGLSGSALARPVTREEATRAAIHPIASLADMNAWLARAPVTRDFPPDFAATLRGQAPAFVIEMSTAPGCVPCADMWNKLSGLRRQYGWQVRTIGGEEAMIRSGRLALPWVGHPVAWVRPAGDPNRIIPIAIGTDHAANLARNIYLAVKMLTGVRADVGVRALSKFTGIVGMTPRPAPRAGRN
ncbi:conjugal transfer protein TraF [Novosphingobium sp. EMRT-2]|nr:conjugal transfer protein TraF [Novosphingobium sp. EMRT-2]QCI95207.1 conjugal transfer protein TraF [Novosphingobium sp. EMRT-2]